LLVAFLDALQVTLPLTAGANEKRRRKPIRISPGAVHSLRRRVNPRAASGGRQWSRRAAATPTVPEGLLCSS